MLNLNRAEKNHVVKHCHCIGNEEKGQGNTTFNSNLLEDNFREFTLKYKQSMTRRERCFAGGYQPCNLQWHVKKQRCNVYQIEGAI